VTDTNPNPNPAGNAVVNPTVLTALPKIELHRHLEGSVRLETLVDTARTYKIELPAMDIEGLRSYVQITPDSPMDSAHFLGKFNLLRRFYYSEEVITRVAREAVEDAAADNIKYMELRFTPKALSRLMNFSFRDVVKWVCNGVDAATAKHDIRVKLIVSMNRHETVKDGERAVEAAFEARSRGIVGLDLAGQEAGYDGRTFAPLFKEAREKGMGVTIHAGEWAGPTNIRDAVKLMGAQRIGHGVRVVEDHRIVQLALQMGTTFEVCPTSNAQSGAVQRLDQHPLRDMYELGLKTTINSDDPSISNITLSDELALSINRLRMTLDDVKRNIINAAQSAFLPDDERAQLVAYFSDALTPIGQT
jgi:adenosine deaminase